MANEIKLRARARVIKNTIQTSIERIERSKADGLDIGLMIRTAMDKGPLETVEKALYQIDTGRDTKANATVRKELNRIKELVAEVLNLPDVDQEYVRDTLGL